MYLEVDDVQLWGCVTTRDIKKLLHDERPNQTVSGITKSCNPENTIGPDVNAMQVLATMRRTGPSRMSVAEGNHLLGILTLKDLFGLASANLELWAA
jgi:CBS domain-containing protein